MANALQNNLDLFDKLIAEKSWKVFSKKEIEHGQQIIVTDGISSLPVNFYTTGKIVVQGKLCELKTTITEWSNLLQAGITINLVGKSTEPPKNRIAKYVVIPDNVEKIQQLILGFSGEIIPIDMGGPAEVYRVEVKRDGNRVTITQYTSSRLMVQGLSSQLFDDVCDELDKHLIQTFSERASRFIVGETERATAINYLEQPDAENDAHRWLFENLDRKVMEFLHPNDQQTLLAAAGVRNAFQKSALPDYSVVVMPFTKPLEGFLIRLAVSLGLTSNEALTKRANQIEVSGWLDAIEGRLPDVKRYGEIHAALEAAWGCRHKAIHSDFVHPLSILITFAEADLEIATILRAMSRSHRVFIEEGIQLKSNLADSSPKNKVSEKPAEHKFILFDRETFRKKLESDGFQVPFQEESRTNTWEVMKLPELAVMAPRSNGNLLIVTGLQASDFISNYEVFLDPNRPWIGVDESGKGDLFGPLVVAGVILTPETEILMARLGVRDSKTISDSQILDLAPQIRENCPVETVILLPPEYNKAYEEQGRNLNKLLAWGHAQVICRLSRAKPVHRAISDQFGDESLIINALESEECKITLEQRPHAESNLAVASASVIARSEFILAIGDYTQKAGVDIPLGASAAQVKEIGKLIYKKWGERGLERIAKMHFKTIQEIITDASHE
jgi:ribonuclease HIII